MDKDKIIEYASSIIYENEGNYSSVNANDNGALSIGKMQWHGDRALELMRDIIEKDSTAKAVLGSSLYNEIKKSSTTWKARTVNTLEKKVISSLLSSTKGKKCQDALAKTDIGIYINKGMSYGLKNPSALIYFADGVNQYGIYSSTWRKICDKSIDIDGGTLDSMYMATKQITKNHLTRRTNTYLNIKELCLDDYRVGDCVVVNGKIYANGNGGNTIEKKNATMYVCDIVSSDRYKYFIGVSKTKGGTRQGYADTSALSKA